MIKKKTSKRQNTIKARPRGTTVHYSHFGEERLGSAQTYDLALIIYGWKLRINQRCEIFSITSLTGDVFVSKVKFISLRFVAIVGFHWNESLYGLESAGENSARCVCVQVNTFPGTWKSIYLKT